VAALDLYGRVFRAPHVAALWGASTIARLPIGINGLAIVLAVRHATGSFAVAGAAAGAYALTLGVSSPLQARLMDRLGPRRVIPPFVIANAVVAVVFVAVLEQAPDWALIALAGIFGLGLPPMSPIMRAMWPRLLGGDPELWGVTALLHDADYERFPDMDDTEKGHPRSIMAELERRDAPPEMVRGIASHADFLHVSRDSDLEKTLYACDELSGFLTACAYVRPEGIRGLTPKSVKKKLKQPSFAAAVNREDVHHGADALGVEFDEHVTFVIAALEERKDELGLTGAGAASG
jgi:predicted hydrolase (HD superfamily)